MRTLVTGSSGHLGEALVHSLRAQDREVIGIDIKPGPNTDRVGDIVDSAFVNRAMEGVQQVLHTATLHKPHVVTHSKQQFVDTNVSGTLNLLEAAVSQQVAAFVFTSTTSVYGHAMRPADDEPAVWIDEEVLPQPKNIYGVTKLAAENLCRLFHQQHGLPVITLRTSRFFNESDDDAVKRSQFSDANIKVSEFLNRRADLEDMVSAHLLALPKASELAYRHLLVSAATPFIREDLAELNRNAAAVVSRRVPQLPAIYAQFGWKQFDRIGRVYDSSKAQRELGWRPKWDIGRVLENSSAGDWGRSQLARRIGTKGYHQQPFTKGADGPFPVADNEPHG